jgi:ubiquinone biosynthesis accessory factor UbiK
MLDPRTLDALAARLAQALPAGLAQLRSELQDNFRVMLAAHLEKLDVVTRERFDVQAELLARTQARLKALEARLADLEQSAGRR